MTPERWAQVKELYHSVVDHDPEDRQPVLQAVRASDPDLCAEVESLLRESDETWVVGRNPFENLDLLEKHAGQLVGGRYRLARLIGRGGFGAVYLAHDERLHDKPVVVKFLIGAALRDAGADGQWLNRKFADEVEALARIDHPGVVVILDQGHTAEGVPFLVMQHVEGVTLRSLIDPKGMPAGRVSQIVRQIGQALSAAHARGILHRDLKPENIMVQATNAGDFVRLIDFGIATIRDEGRGDGESTRAVGTAAYMAPEQFRGSPAPASDIFAMGVIAWEMLMGKVPSDAPAEPRADISQAAVAALRRALSLDPAARFPNASGFGEELAEALLSGGGPATPPHESQVQQRVLDVAAARQIPIHKPAEVVALIRRNESGGLSAILEVDRDYSVTREDVRSKPFHLEFPLDEDGRPTDLELGLRLDCPDFDPRSAFKTILVPPGRDSEACTFLVTPLYLGELRINLEVVRGHVLVASRTLKTESLPSDRVADSSKTVVSMELPVLVREAPPVMLDAMLGAMAKTRAMMPTVDPPAPRQTPQVRFGMALPTGPVPGKPGRVARTPRTPSPDAAPPTPPTAPPRPAPPRQMTPPPVAAETAPLVPASTPAPPRQMTPPPPVVEPSRLGTSSAPDPRPLALPVGPTLPGADAASPAAPRPAVTPPVTPPPAAAETAPLVPLSAPALPPLRQMTPPAGSAEPAPLMTSKPAAAQPSRQWLAYAILGVLALALLLAWLLRN